MGNFKRRLAAFMYGRYGADSLYYALSVAWLIAFLLGIITHLMLFRLLSYILLIYMTFRVFSKNTAKRQAENAAYLKLRGRIKEFFRLQKNRISDFRRAVYRHCPQCHAVLRLPHRRGKHTTVCPRCAHRFDVHIPL